MGAIYTPAPSMRLCPQAAQDKTVIVSQTVYTKVAMDRTTIP
jgi:hypothetical protein